MLPLVLRPHVRFARIVASTVIILGGGGCADLFHSTDWSSACDKNSAARGCPSGAGTTTGTEGSAGAGVADTTGSFDDTSAATTGGAGLGGAGAGAGGVGGAGGDDATGGQGGAGGTTNTSDPPGPMCSTCHDVGKVVTDGTPGPSPSTLCPGASQSAWDAVYACVCMSKCAGACSATACQLTQASSECIQCAALGCLSEIQACDGS